MDAFLAKKAWPIEWKFLTLKENRWGKRSKQSLARRGCWDQEIRSHWEIQLHAFLEPLQCADHAQEPNPMQRALSLKFVWLWAGGSFEPKLPDFKRPS